RDPSKTAASRVPANSERSCRYASAFKGGCGERRFALVRDAAPVDPRHPGSSRASRLSMKILPHAISRHGGLLLAIVLFVLTRTLTLTTFPIFNDEAIYLQYSQSI